MVIIEVIGTQEGEEIRMTSTICGLFPIRLTDGYNNALMDTNETGCFVTCLLCTNTGYLIKHLFHSLSFIASSAEGHDSCCHCMKVKLTSLA